MKRLFFVFLLVAFAGFCSAASIEAQDSVPASTVWSFSVTLPNGADFSNAEVLLDSGSLVQFYTSPSDQIVVYNEDNSRLFSVTTASSSRVFLLVSPLAKGTHTITLKVDGSSAADKTITFFEIGSFDDKQSIQDQIALVKNTVNSITQQVDSLEQESLTQEDRQELQAGINTLQASLQELDTRLSEDTQKKANVLVGDIQVLQQRVDDLNKAGGFGVGFALLPQVDGGTAMIGLLIAALVVIAILVIKFKDKIPVQRNMYGKFKKDAPVFSVRDDEIAEQVSSQASTDADAGSGKWAFDQSPPKPRSKFGFRDFLKK